MAELVRVLDKTTDTKYTYPKAAVSEGLDIVNEPAVDEGGTIIAPEYNASASKRSAPKSAPKSRPKSAAKKAAPSSKTDDKA